MRVCERGALLLLCYGVCVRVCVCVCVCLGVFVLFLNFVWFGCGFFVCGAVVYDLLQISNIYVHSSVHPSAVYQSCIAKAFALGIMCKLFKQILSHLPCL